MTTLREAATMALEAMQSFQTVFSMYEGEFADEIAALRAALAEPKVFAQCDKKHTGDCCEDPYCYLLPSHDYERGFIDGMQEQMKRSVDRAVNAMADQEQPVCDECGKSKRDGWALYCVDCMEPLFAQPQNKEST